MAKILMIKTAEEVKKNIQIDMLSSFIKADTEKIEDKHSGNYISNLNFYKSFYMKIPNYTFRSEL